MDFDATRENELIESARGGDSQAFDMLVQRYQEYLFRLMVRACHHPDDAEEVASEAFARAYEKLGQFEGRSSFVSWLGRIATNLCFRRREKREVETVEDAHDSLEEWGSDWQDDSPELAAMRQEMRRVIRSAVEALPEPEQTILRLRDIDECSTHDTALQTGLSEAAVKSRLHRARKMLRVKLASQFGL